MFLNLAWQYGGAILAIVCCAYALWQGGRVERYAAGIILIGWMLTLLLQSHSLSGPGLWVQIIDGVALALFVALSLWSRRIFTLFLSACQLDTVMAHFSQMSLHSSQWVIAMVLGLWGGQGLLLCLVAGVIGYRRGLKRRARSRTEPI